jgi:uncharacterized iron-regulated protein
MGALQKLSYKLFSDAKKRASDFLGTEGGLRTYLKNFNGSIPSQPRKAIAPAEVQNRLNGADIVLVGDFHTLEKSQDGFLHLLQQVRSESNAVVALEVFERSCTLLSEASSKKTDPKKLIKSLQKNKMWNMSEPGYEKIIEHCQTRDIKIEGISPQTRDSLKETDLHFANAILELRAKHPHQKIFVLVGESHLAPEHLPAQLKKMQHQAEIPFLRTRVLSVLQNVDSHFFWNLKKSSYPFSPFEINRDTISITSVAPHQKWESVINQHIHGHEDLDPNAADQETEEAWEFALGFLQHFKMHHRKDDLARLQVFWGVKDYQSCGYGSEAKEKKQISQDLLQYGYSWSAKNNALVLLKDSGNTQTISAAFILMTKKKLVSPKKFTAFRERLNGLL